MKKAFLLFLFCQNLAVYGDEVDFTTLRGKVLFGYQAWFDCPGPWGGDWRHWNDWDEPSIYRTKVEMYPDLREFAKEDLCPAGDLTLNGEQAYFYSNLNPAVADKHFQWMRDYELDGILVQRFVGRITRNWDKGDPILKNIMAAAKKYGRTFAIEYDVTTNNFDQFDDLIQADWTYLMEDLDITSHPSYLHHNGKPVVSVWGMGMYGGNDRRPPRTPEEAIALVSWLRTTGGAYVMGGTPHYWRTLNKDAATTDTNWLEYYASLDVLQPWSVGRYTDLEDISTNLRRTRHDDREWVEEKDVMYMPTIFPGFSWSKWHDDADPNQISRLDGNFLWQQAYEAFGVGAEAIKIAMFDEVDEGTAMYKLAPTRQHAPDQHFWLTLDADGANLPSDWYLHLAGLISKTLKSGSPLPAEIPLKPEELSVNPDKRDGKARAPENGNHVYMEHTPLGIWFKGLNNYDRIRLLNINGEMIKEVNVKEHSVFLPLDPAHIQGVTLAQLQGKHKTLLKKIARF